MTLSSAIPVPPAVMTGRLLVRPAFLVLLGSGGLLLGALAFQYIGKMPPCALCYWQRYGYWATIALGLVAIFFSRQPKSRKFWLYLTGTALLCVVGISFFHVGVEQGWWQGTAACVGASGLGDGGLEGIGADPARGERALHQGRAFGDLLAIPEGAVLLIEQDEFAFGGAAGGATGFM